MASNRRRYVTKALVQQHGETPGCSACLGIASQHTATCRERFERLINPIATDAIPTVLSITEEDQQPDGGAAPVEQQQQAAQPTTGQLVRPAAGTKRGMEDSSAPSSVKRAHTPPASSQISPQPDVEMSAVLVPDNPMEVNTSCEEEVSQPDVEPFFDRADEFFWHNTGGILDRDAATAGIRAKLVQTQEFVVFEWKLRSEKPVGESSISTKMFHEANGDEVRSRIVAREYADGVSAPEHHAGTPPTWELKLVISSMMPKSCTRQLASRDVSVAFFHAWLGRGVWVKPTKELKAE